MREYKHIHRKRDKDNIEISNVKGIFMFILVIGFCVSLYFLSLYVATIHYHIDDEIVHNVSKFQFEVERVDYATDFNVSKPTNLCDIETLYVDNLICYVCIDRNQSVLPGWVDKGDIVCPV